MEILIAIVSLVCSIFTIVLFFKVWKACDNINKIASKDPNPIDLIVSGEKDKGIEALKIEYVMLLRKAYQNGDTSNIINTYLPVFKRLGVELPDELKSDQEFRSYLKKLLN